MTPLDIQDHRVARLQELLDKKFDGKKVELGRALGHKTGAFVRQLLDRERPITEKTVLAIHALPGCHGWFDQAGSVKTQAMPQQPAVTALDRPQLAESLADALGDALQGLPAAMYARSVDACRRLAEAPDSNRARTEMWDVLQHSDALRAPPVPPKSPSPIDKAFREAFYALLDEGPDSKARAIVNELRDAIEQRVASQLGIDREQAQRALAARQ